MKRILGIVIAVVLIMVVVSCTSLTTIPLPSSGWLFESMEVYGAESGNVTVEGNIMAVFYTQEERPKALFWVTDALIVDTGDGKWDVTSPQLKASGVNQATVSYGLYSYKPLPDLSSGGVFLDSLGLGAITAKDLPRSEHIGMLTAVNAGLVKPATVTRKYMGQTYDVQCLVEQDIVDMWIADTLNVGDYVIVSFIEEIPNTTEINIAIVTGKVYKSW